MARTLSVYRRRPGLVDLTIASRPGVRAFIFKHAPNFDVGAVPFQQVPITGYRSPSAPIGPAEGFRGLTRFAFNPSDYGIDDAKPIWLRVSAVNVDGSVGPDEALHLVMPFPPHGRRAIVLNGLAPSGADVSESLELNLPFQCQGLEIQNNGSQNLHVAFEPGGPEFLVFPLSTGYTNLAVNYPAFHQIFVRGDGGPVNFSAVTSARDEKA